MRGGPGRAPAPGDGRPRDHRAVPLRRARPRSASRSIWWRTAAQAPWRWPRRPSGFGAGLAAPLEGAIAEGPLELLFYDPRNTPPATFARLLSYGTANIAAGVAQQLGRVGEGHFESADGKVDFRRDMARIETPVLVVAARLDRVAPVPAVKDGYRALGGPKEWLMVSEAHGAKAEYGHMDLVVGNRAGEEVWSKVLGFFERHR